jgi:hypothetical protein
MGDLTSQQSAIVDFMAVSRPTVEGLDLTLGRAGVLLACALLLDALPAGGLLTRRICRRSGSRRSAICGSG